MGKSRNNKYSKAAKAAKAASIHEEDLNRFAGSSEEEEEEEEEEVAMNDKEDDDDGHPHPQPQDSNDADVEDHVDTNNDDDSDSDIGNDSDSDADDRKDAKKAAAATTNSIDDEDGNENDEDGGDDDDDFSVDLEHGEEQVMDPAVKMANAMGHILGAGFKKKRSPMGKDQQHPKQNDSVAAAVSNTNAVPAPAPPVVVLAKTTTPLQRQQQKEKEQLKALKHKRQVNRERNLAALHMPLSIATTTARTTTTTGGSTGGAASSIAQELEQERLLRRVATRGVVALFNAISQHQKAGPGKQTTGSSGDGGMAPKRKDSNSSTSKVTKHAFLDQIKSAAVKSSAMAKVDDDADNTKNGLSKKRNDPLHGDDDKARNKSSSTPAWGALRDDFMLGKSKKGWDEESSEDDKDRDNDEEEEIPVLQDLDDDAVPRPSFKSTKGGRDGGGARKKQRVSGRR